jgi:hypothetical protein
MTGNERLAHAGWSMKGKKDQEALENSLRFQMVPGKLARVQVGLIAMKKVQSSRLFIS